MSIVSLNTGLRSLLAAQYALDTVGHNIANANTPGYSRQRLEISNELPLRLGGLLIGNGVRADAVGRSVDALLNRRIHAQVTTAGRLEAQLGGMVEVEAMFGTFEGEGIDGLMDGLFTAFSELSSDPADPVLRAGVGQAALSLTSRFNGLTADMGNLRRDVAGELDARVAEVNALAQEILTLNLEIESAEGTGVAANDLRDRRDLALEKMSRHVDVTSVEDPSGSLRVMVEGATLVSSSRVYELEAAEDVTGKPRVRIDGAAGYLPIEGGTLGGLLSLESEFLPGLSGELNQLARNLILEFNRLHSRGIPASGSFTELVGTGQLQDVDQDGKIVDELLSGAGLPFDVVSGELHVNVNEEATGDVTRSVIEITATHTTVGDLVAQLNAVDHLSAEVDATGHLRIVADAGHSFDFAPKLDPVPDSAGSFGSGKASVGGSPGPYGLSDGDTIDLTVPGGGGPLSIVLSATDFEDVNAATAQEVAAVINADAGAQAAGIVAAAVDGRLFLQTAGEGATASFTVDGGSALTALGLDAFAGSTISGHADSVEPQVFGSYTGDGPARFSFVPNMDGTIGTTPGLVVEVFDENGNSVATLDVGPEYTPGEELVVGQGISVAFGLGELSATHGDRFTLDVVSETDSADALVALGLNSFFTGSGAADIGLREDLEFDPAGISTSFSGASGDNALLMQLLGLQHATVEGLGATFGQFHGDTIGDLGFDVASTQDSLESSASLLSGLNQLKQSVSGVNVDEELVDMVRFEQAFAAASQFINVVNQLQDDLLSIL